MEMFFQDHHFEIQEKARRFVQEEVLPHVEEWEEQQKPPIHLLPKAGKLGLLGPHFPTEYGGNGTDVVSTCIVAEEIGKSAGGVLCSLLGSSVVAIGPIAHFGNERQKRAYLAPALRGEKVAAIAMTEPDAGSDVSGISTTAVKQGDYYRIDGEKIFITNGTVCDFILVAARTGTVEDRHRGLSLFLADTPTPGFSVKRKLNKLGWRSSDTAALTFENCKVPAENLVGELHRGFYHLMHNLDVERLVLAADGVGLAQTAFTSAMDYAKKRSQFGRPISDNQVIKHMLVDMHVGVEAARSLVYQAAWKLDRKQPAAREASTAKYFACELVRKVTSDAMQIYGGQGFLMDNAVQRYYRDAPVYTVGAGTSQIQKEIIAKQLGL